jgi:hypothetical protein
MPDPKPSISATVGLVGALADTIALVQEEGKALAQAHADGLKAGQQAAGQRKAVFRAFILTATLSCTLARCQSLAAETAKALNEILGEFPAADHTAPPTSDP